LELELTEEQEFFQQTTRKFLAAECPISLVRELEHEPAGFTMDYWKRGAELGWTSMLVPEEHGGGSLSGEGLRDVVLVAEEMGRMVSPGPLLPVNVVAAAIAEGGSAEQQQAVLPGIVSGEVVAAWCYSGDVESGVVAPVEAGAQAQWLLVAADGAHALLAADTPGVQVTPLEGLDLVKRFAEVRFDGVDVPASARVNVDGERLLQLAVAIQCAETVGAADRIFEMTVEYASDRYSFGRPLSSYQALKHRFADMKMWLEACHATATAAAKAVQHRDPDAAEVVSAAKAYIGSHATEIIQDCVQMHGGIGVTWEHDIHLYLRRATVNRTMYGTPAEHLERLAAVLLGA
jgi:alkylation response protein AidB-like acyl-CoA dehydrogenase